MRGKPLDRGSPLAASERLVTIPAVPDSSPATSPLPNPRPTLGENSFNPGQPTPRVNRLMHNERDLTDYEKQLVDRFVALYGPSDRALITLDKVFNFCHLVEQSTSQAQLIRLSFVWGCISEIYNVHEPDNIIKEAPTEHYQLDHHQLAHIPAKKAH
ncbi:hypothetical protein C8J56DRAFT_1157429 [Mycena floridula]|nr:hypothetical protein C8J56DRAFT_1157429 [Mycena floridula]